MAESNNEELVLFPSYKIRKIDLHYEAATSMENLSISTDSNKLFDSCETILAESNFDNNEEAVIEHEIPIVYKYCHQLLKESQLWHLDDTDIAMLLEYKACRVSGEIE